MVWRATQPSRRWMRPPPTASASTPLAGAAHARGLRRSPAGQRDLHRALGGDGGRLLLRGARPEAVQREELRRVERRMRQMWPRTRDHPRARDAAGGDRVYESRGEEDKARLLGHRERDWAHVVPPARAARLPAGYMAPSTGCLTHFLAARAAHRVHVAFPASASAGRDGAADALPEALRRVRAGRRLARSAGNPQRRALNDAIARDRTSEVSLVAEALQSRASPASPPHRRDPRRSAWCSSPDRALRQDDVCQAPGRAVAGERHPADAARPRRLLRRSRRDPRDEKGEFDYETIRASTSSCSASTSGRSPAADRRPCRATTS